MDNLGNFSNSEYRYTFEKGSKKHLCPQCDKKRFVRYIDTETDDYLPERYGRCDRENKCGYHLNPYTDNFGITEITQITVPQQKYFSARPKPGPRSKTVFIPIDIFNRTRAGYEKNIFIQNLLTRVTFPFEVQDVEKVISLYHLGTVQNGYRSGAITFPFIDVCGNVRTIQVKQFDQTNHTTGTDFLHSIIEKHHTWNNKPLPGWLEAYNKNETKVSCLFGEHLLNKYPHSPVALVEAPKTAIYGTLYFGISEQPTNLLWLAVYNLSSLNLNKCHALKGRDVYLFPDLSKDGKAFELWSHKASEIQKKLPGTHLHVSDLLERLAPEQDKEQGKDIADYLIKQDWRLFRTARPQPIARPFEIPTSKEDGITESTSKKQSYFFTDEVLNLFDRETIETWDKEISELETYFPSITLPTQPIKLNQCSTITDCSLFIESHIAAIKANNGKRIFLPYLNRLEELKKILIAK